MNRSDVPAGTATMTDVRLDRAPDLPAERDAVVGSAGRPGRRQRGERLMVPKAEFRSYYGRPVLNGPTWQAPDIAGYLFLGGLAGASSTLAAAAELTGRPALARGLKAGAATAIAGSLYSLVHDLGRPERFVNMLRVVKVTSPMSIGSWLLAGYAPMAIAAAGSAVTGRLPVPGRLATIGAALLGPAVAAYTGALISNTAVPAWHEGHREMPLLFVGSAAASAGGLGLLVGPGAESGPARRAALLGAVAELTMTRRLEQRLGPLAEPLQQDTGGALIRAGKVLSATAALTLALGGRNRKAGVAAGVALLAGSLCTRFGIFHAGLASARDPKYTVGPQRERLAARDRAAKEPT
ncbi:NrfD/PsrC family molybdoenzyme membrane anchor subunit [Micromonospora sp. NPDC049523]|uniref:NrfD/PsrC family molybdoenzyme membrane anchor subunit n=1 Tax=Micromonospora sp. NPDC049523 TaxID=3155921 RepID=UPI00341AA874